MDDVILLLSAEVEQMAGSSLAMELDGVSHKILQAMITSGQTTVEPRAIDVVIMQGHIRESMRQVLIALSPNLGIPQEHLLSEFDQLIAPDSETHIQSRSLAAAGLASIDSPQGQLTFQHECL